MARNEEAAVAERILDPIGDNQMVQTQELHCQSCGRFICYYALVWGHIKIKCPNCKGWIVLDISPDN